MISPSSSRWTDWSGHQKWIAGSLRCQPIGSNQRNVMAFTAQATYGWRRRQKIVRGIQKVMPNCESWWSRSYEGPTRVWGDAQGFLEAAGLMGMSPRQRWLVEWRVAWALHSAALVA